MLARKREPALAIEPTEVEQAFGTVLRRHDDLRVAVALENGIEVDARRAVSCLVQPNERDTVLVAGGGSAREWFVLAVLSREAGAPVELSAEGDMSVNLRAGEFTVAAQQGVNLLSPASVRLAAGELHVRAREGNIAVKALMMAGEMLQGNVGTARLVANALESVLDRVTQRVKRSYRFIEETDIKHAEHVDHVASQTMHLRARDALVTAQELVKIDGQQVHLG